MPRVDQIVKQLNKLVNVIKVQDFREGEYVDRELVLVKVAVDSKTRAEVMQITDIFRAKIVDVQPKSLTIEVTGDESKVEKLLSLMKTFGVHGTDAHGQGGPAAQVMAGRYENTLTRHRQRHAIHQGPRRGRPRRESPRLGGAGIRPDSQPAARREGAAPAHVARRHRQRHPPRAAPGQSRRRRGQSHRRERTAARLCAARQGRARSSARPNSGATPPPPPSARRSPSKLGGLKKTIRALGNAVLPGFTASKILWLKKHEPKNYQRLATVLLAARLPEFLAHRARRRWNTATPAAPRCSTCASGNGRSAVLEAIDPDLAGKLPPLMRSDQPAGPLQASTAKQLDLNPGVLVSAGGGDNMMGAIGTGNTRAGVITASFGTSGTIYACAEKPVVDPQGEIAAFCDSTNRWLPLLCTMNVTVATEMVREDFGWSHEKFAAEAARDSGGLATACCCCRISKASARRTCRTAPGVWFGVNQKTFEAGHFARAAMEGVTLGMNYGLRRLAELGVKPTQIRATGGGAKSKVWRQIMADVFNAEVVTLKVSEGAAYGAALQALWCWRLQQGEKVSISDITDQFVELNPGETAQPEARNVAVYRELQHSRTTCRVAARRVRQAPGVCSALA